MSERPQPVPVEVRAPRDVHHVDIEWEDGTSSRFSNRLLRGFCPCAYCQGHQGPIRWASGANALDPVLEDIEEVGNYALRLTWSDGHSTGIYSFRFLWELHPLSLLTLDEARGRTFGR